MKKLIILIIVMAALIVLTLMRCFYINSNTIKTAITKNSLKQEDYIICQSVRVTGFDWITVNSKNNREYCNIIGADPFTELNLSYNFTTADNSFIFYVKERRENYSEKMKENCVEYVVSGWDILYPVKHGDTFNIFKSPRYITQNDTNN